MVDATIALPEPAGLIRRPSAANSHNRNEPYFTADQMRAMYQQGHEAGRSCGVGEVPAGWKLVPIEPNWDMRNEGREFLIDGTEKEPEKLAYFLWKTMVAAAPEVE